MLYEKTHKAEPVRLSIPTDLQVLYKAIFWEND